MNKKNLLIGFLLGLLTALVGTFLFLTCFTNFDGSAGIQIIKERGYLGKVITLGTLLNLVVFTLLLKRNKELMARGVVLAVIVLAISTLFI